MIKSFTFDFTVSWVRLGEAYANNIGDAGVQTGDKVGNVKIGLFEGVYCVYKFFSVLSSLWSHKLWG